MKKATCHRPSCLSLVIVRLWQIFFFSVDILCHLLTAESVFFSPTSSKVTGSPNHFDLHQLRDRFNQITVIAEDTGR